MKYIYMLLILISFSAIATENYQYKGVITRQVAGGEQIIINSKTYTIDNETIIHGEVSQGEAAPVFDKGQTIGFSIDEDGTRISSVWINPTE